MDFRSLLQTMYTINEGETKETTKGREHKGTYGTSHGKEDVRDQYGHKIGKVNKGASEKKSDAPKKRGRPTKAAKDETGADIKHDTSGIQAMLGKKPSKEVGKVSKKHSLKDWIESVESNKLNEDGQYVTKPIPQQATQLQQVIGPDGRPALNQPIPTSAALRVANALSSTDGSQGMAEGELDTSHMNKSHKDFYDKNPNMKRDDREVVSVGGRLATKVTPTKKPAPITKKPMGSFQGVAEADVEESGLQAYLGNKKYGKEGMNALRKAGQEHASEKEKQNIRAKYSKKEDMAESQLDEKYIGFEKTKAAVAKTGAKDPGAVAASIGRKKYGKEKFQKAAAAGKKLGEEKDLPGKQDKLDVAEPKGKLTKADFEKLRSKKKVKESILSEGAVKALLDTLIADIDTATHKNRSPFNIKGLSPEVAKKRLLSVVQHDDRFENLPDDQQRSLVNLALEFLRDEGELDETKSPLSMQDRFRQHADLSTSHNANVPVIAPTAFKTDPIQAVTDRGINAAHSMGKKASGFLKSLNPFSIKESTDMKDIQIESWEKELNSLLNEGITVSSSTGQQGSPDSVSINATDADAQELLAIVRQAGLGVFGGDKPQSDYGAPMHDEPEGHGTEPEMAPAVVGDDNDMLALIKKMTGIDMGGSDEEGSGDYEDEEGSEDTALQPADSDSEEGEEEADKEEVSELRAEYPGGSTDFNTGEVKTTGGTNEGEMEEGNAFTGKLKQTPQGGEFKMGDKTYKDTSSLEEDDMEEGNMFTGNLAKARAQGKSEADLDGDGDMEKVREGQDETCNECGYTMENCGCDHVEEGYANEAGHDELAQLKTLLSMGNDMHRVKHSPATGNIQKVTMETKLMKESSDLLVDYKKLSGIK